VVATVPYRDFYVDADTVRFVNSGVFLFLKTRFQLAQLKIIRWNKGSLWSQCPPVWCTPQWSQQTRDRQMTTTNNQTKYTNPTMMVLARPQSPICNARLRDEVPCHRSTMMVRNQIIASLLYYLWSLELFARRSTTAVHGYQCALVADSQY